MKLLRTIWTVICRNEYEIIILMLLTCSLILSLILERTKADRDDAIRELTELRVEREWRTL